MFDKVCCPHFLPNIIEFLYALFLWQVLKFHERKFSNVVNLMVSMVFLNMHLHRHLSISNPRYVVTYIGVAVKRGKVSSQRSNGL